MTEAEQYALHENPVWRERANFILHAAIDGGRSGKKFEQLWAHRVADNEFELCCIPFFAYDLALGDVVSTAPRDGKTYVVDRVVRPSGRYTFRVWFGDSFHPRDEVEAELVAMGAMCEWSSRNLLAVAATDAAHAQRVADYLAAGEDAKRFVYETGRLT